MKEIINNEIFKSTIEVLIPFIITFVLGLIENHKSKTIKAAYPAIVKLVDSLFNNKDSNLKREHAVNYLRAEILATTPKYLRWLVYPFVNTCFLKYKADPYQQLPSIVFWTMGSFNSVVWAGVVKASFIIALGLICIYLLRWWLNPMALGDEDAAALGIDVPRARFIYIIIIYS